MIKSTDREVRTLIEALKGDAAHCEGAVARLIIIGERAVARLIAAYESCRDRATQTAILQVLESTGDDRALPVARQALSDGGDCAVAAVAVLKELLDRGSLSVQADALDLLVAAASDPAAERRVRLAAGTVVDAISKAIDATGRPLLIAEISTTRAVWEDAADGHLPDDPETLRAAALEHAANAPLPTVHRIVEFTRAREDAVRSLSRSADAGDQVRQWRGVRGVLHQLLALRGSRIALYDLRETLAASSGEPLPSSFLAAIQLVGDASCLEPLATAFARSAEDSANWRHHLATTFHAVAKREHVTTKHSAMRRALARSPQLA